TALVNNMRVAQRYKPLGRNIGFTNRRMGDVYGIHAPIWRYGCDRTMQDLAVPLPRAAYTEPKVEPCIMFRLLAEHSPRMGKAALLSCVAWVAHGFEIAQSSFRDWKFPAADTIVANAMHGALLLGSRHDIGSRAGEWLHTLANFDIELYFDGQLMDPGHPSNVLGGPLSSVRHLVELLSRGPDHLPLPAGEIVACGTLMAAPAG